MYLGGLSCTICTDLFKDSDNVHSTTCGHLYHLDCLTNWLTKSTTCPQCRSPFPQFHKVYLTINTDAEKLQNIKDDAGFLEALANVQTLNKELLKENEKLNKEVEDLRAQLKEAAQKKPSFEENTKTLERDLKLLTGEWKRESQISLEKIKILENCIAEMMTLKENGSAGHNQMEANDDTTDTMRRSVSIVYFPKTKMTAIPFATVHTLCKLILPNLFAEDEIVSVSTFESKYYPSRIKLNIEFKSIGIRDKFIADQDKLFDLCPEDFDHPVKIVDCMSDDQYNICAYAYKFLRMPSYPAADDEFNITTVFETKEEIYSIASGIYHTIKDCGPYNTTI